MITQLKTFNFSDGNYIFKNLRYKTILQALDLIFLLRSSQKKN